MFIGTTAFSACAKFPLSQYQPSDLINSSNHRCESQLPLLEHPPKSQITRIKHNLNDTQPRHWNLSFSQEPHTLHTSHYMLQALDSALSNDRNYSHTRQFGTSVLSHPRALANGHANSVRPQHQVVLINSRCLIPFVECIRPLAFDREHIASLRSGRHDAHPSIHLSIKCLFFQCSGGASGVSPNFVHAALDHPQDTRT